MMTSRNTSFILAATAAVTSRFTATMPPKMETLSAP